tara:strand:- start:35 stop:757 length:723 start_codon:yes stop_codon:yes gene_type:complete
VAGQKGFIYEAAIHNKLKNKGLVPLGFKPAKSDPNKPDGKFIYNGEIYNLEVKLDMQTDFGQGTLDYTPDGWVLGGVQEFKADGVTPRDGYAAAEKMRELLRSIGTEEFANQKWGFKKAPNKVNVPNDSNFTQAMKDEDYKNFPSRFKPIDKKSIWDYYAVKSTYYIQIGGYGLYYMSANPANLPIPQFNVSARLRIRMKPSQSYPVYSYGFKTAILVQGKPMRSTMDLDRRTDLDKLVA